MRKHNFFVVFVQNNGIFVFGCLFLTKNSLKEFLAGASAVEMNVKHQIKIKSPRQLVVIGEICERLIINQSYLI